MTAMGDVATAQLNGASFAKLSHNQGSPSGTPLLNSTMIIQGTSSPVMTAPNGYTATRTFGLGPTAGTTKGKAGVGVVGTQHGRKNDPAVRHGRGSDRPIGGPGIQCGEN